MANGIAVSGSGIGSFTLPNLFRLLVEEYGLFGCLLILSAIMLNISVFGLLLRPLSSYAKENKSIIVSEEKEPLKVEMSTRDVEENSLFDHSSSANVSQSENKSCEVLEVEYMEKKQVSDLDHDAESVSFRGTRATNGQIKDSHVSAVADSDQQGMQRYKRSSNGDVMFASLQSIPQDEMDKASRKTWRNIKNRLCCRRSSSEAKVKIFDWSLLRNPVWWVWGISCFLGNTGYPNVFIMLAPHVEDVSIAFMCKGVISNQSNDYRVVIYSL